MPAHWYLALSMLAGQAASSLLVQVAAFAGTEVLPLWFCAAAILVVGLTGHALAPRGWTGSPRPSKGAVRAVAGTIILVSFVLLLAISIAPSTKIDELHYHMLIGRRIVEDHGLLVYQLPFEQAIVPQMGFQIFESVFHALHVMDAGNVLSLGFFAALAFLVFGVVAEESGSPDAGLIAAAAISAGVFPAVWDVTAGPHALGELGTFTAVAALVLPGRFNGAHDERRNRGWTNMRAYACILGAACAASTKISLVPLGVGMTVLAVFHVPRTRRLKVALVAAALWSLILGPLVAWTYAHTGSPFGAAFAEWFSGSTYQPVVLERLADTRSGSQLDNPLPYIAEATNGLSIALMVYGAFACLRRPRRFGLLAALVAVQLVLIYLLLPYNIRFLGGLQLGLLAVGAVALADRVPRRPSPWLVAASALLLLGPWLVLEAVYGWPFVRLALGLTTPSQFRDATIAFNRDFEALDRSLPRDAALYAPDERPPAVYAPRPMIFDLADWNGRSPVFKFKVGNYGESPEYIARQRALHLDCRQIFYSNPSAVAVTYRTPGQPPLIDHLIVRKCTRAPR